MIPFRVFDRANQEMLIVLNYHPDSPDGGSYLVARQDDSDADGDMKIIPATELAKFRMVDFLEELDEFGN